MKKILIVDDSKIIQKLMKSSIEQLGSTVVGIADDGDEGLELFKKLSPDLTFLDITMPNKDGRECLIDILKFNPKAKVIMFSALSSDQIKDELIKLGAKGFIDKSTASQREALLASISDFLKEEIA